MSGWGGWPSMSGGPSSGLINALRGPDVQQMISNQPAVAQLPNMATANITGLTDAAYQRQLQNYMQTIQQQGQEGKTAGSLIGGVAGMYFGPVGSMVGSYLGGGMR